MSLGQFYHDITLFAASEAGGGDPLRSVFPTEGAILDSGFWSISKTTENLGGVPWRSSTTCADPKCSRSSP